MKPLIRITGPLRCCLSLLQSRRRRRRRLDDPSPFPIVMILPFSSSKVVIPSILYIIIFILYKLILMMLVLRLIVLCFFVLPSFIWGISSNMFCALCIAKICMWLSWFCDCIRQLFISLLSELEFVD
ncbi:uncharacterized protein DS421_12g374510 [Arachis hypogaea]|nr:uncharacterized protein DS421_12g374510 [Arachis hypogaea]